MIPPPLDEQLIHAFCALKIRDFYAHDLQGFITEWIRDNYGPVNPETVQRTWRRMMENPEIVVTKEKKGRLVRYHLVRLGSIWLDPNQLEMF